MMDRRTTPTTTKEQVPKDNTFKDTITTISTERKITQIGEEMLGKIDE
jgi:hypothetical protein